MLPPLIRRPRQKATPRSRERGVTMALVALAMVSIIAMAALSIDVGTLYQAKDEAQRTADAAALAAARVISISGITGDPSNTSNSWQPACGGGSSAATLAAITVAQQNLISGLAVPTASVTVNYGAGSAGASSTDCTSAGAAFAVNPVVAVTVQSAKLPIFFARVFSLFGSSYASTTVKATATAEVFNPSGSSPMVPVNPRCVKPWVVPNLDPGAAGTCAGNACKKFVDPTTGAIQSGGVATAGVIGETFNLFADCATTRGRGPRVCALTDNPPVANGAGLANSLDYVPGQVSNASIAIAANSTINACADACRNDYSEAIAGCDQSTVYACGTALANTVDLSEDPGPRRNDSVNAAACLINASANFLGNGQDYLSTSNSPPPTYAYPFQILAGSNSALLTTGIASGSQITSSPSIVSLPIYDNTAPALLSGTGTTLVTVVGFLQVFINSVDSTTGNINVTVMNVSGCGNSAASTAVNGTSPVPIRLITPP